MRPLGWVVAVGLFVGAALEACGTDAVAPDDLTPDASLSSEAGQGQSTHDDASVQVDATTEDAEPPADAGTEDQYTAPVDSGPFLLANGAACSVDVDAGDAGSGNCQSGHCIDSVCCATTCDGVCMRCDTPDAGGVCTPVAAGNDPDVECLGAGKNAGACSGACDGAGACSFPETACGAAATCIGQVSNQNLCANGVCVSASQDCSVNGFCDSTKGLCDGLQDNGTKCGANNQCKTGKCIDAACCATSCSTPSSCSTGACLCNGVACTAGAACISWYLDSDGDGYGAPTSGPAVVSCANVTPPDSNGKHYQPSTKPNDCYDANANAYPSSSFASSNNRGDGSFDYNCDGKETQEQTVNVQGQTCNGCAIYNPYAGDPCNNACSTWCGTNCNGVPTAILQFGCSTSCANPGTVASHPDEGWLSATPACGQTGTWGQCSGVYRSKGNCEIDAPTQTPMKQSCY